MGIASVRVSSMRWGKELAQSTDDGIKEED